MKQGIKVSATTGIRGSKIDPTIIVGNRYKGYASGAVLDANAIMELMEEKIAEIAAEIAVGIDTVTSENIKDGTIQMVDLSEDVANRLTSEYNEDDESLHMNGN